MNNTRYPNNNRNEFYHLRWAELFSMSQILNPNAHEHPTLSSILDLGNTEVLQMLIDERVGDKDGKYIKDLDQWTAKIPACKQDLKLVYDRFAGYLISLVHQGHRLASEWPNDLWNKRIEIEATIDFYEAEVEAIKKLQSKVIKHKQQRIEETEVLRQGIWGGATLRNGVIDEIDGQHCGFVDKEGNISTPHHEGMLRGVLKDQKLIIISKSSPYYGMAVEDYRDLSLAYCRAKSEINSLTYRLSAEFEQKGLMKDFPLRWEHDKQKIIKNNGWKKLFDLKFKGHDIPSWPNGVKHYITQQTEDASIQNDVNTNIPINDNHSNAGQVNDESSSKFHLVRDPKLLERKIKLKEANEEAERLLNEDVKPQKIEGSLHNRAMLGIKMEQGQIGGGSDYLNKVSQL